MPTTKNSLNLFGVFSLGVGLWAAASAILGSGEPWDSPYYLGWYLVSLTIGATAGWVFPARSWCWGPIIVLGQAPLLLMNARLEPMFAFAVGWLALEAFPAAVVSAVAGKAKELWLRRR